MSFRSSPSTRLSSTQPDCLCPFPSPFPFPCLRRLCRFIGVGVPCFLHRSILRVLHPNRLVFDQRSSSTQPDRRKSSTRPDPSIALYFNYSSCVFQPIVSWTDQSDQRSSLTVSHVGYRSVLGWLSVGCQCPSAIDRSMSCRSIGVLRPIGVIRVDLL